MASRVCRRQAAAAALPSEESEAVCTGAMGHVQHRSTAEEEPSASRRPEFTSVLREPRNG